jgi:pimeloyl-ACP methyl ester carboxylesterase
VALRDALEIDKAIYVVHDWGAIIVWNHALLHLDRVVGVANLSVPFYVRDPADPVALWGKMLDSEFYTAGTGFSRSSLIVCFSTGWKDVCGLYFSLKSSARSCSRFRSLRWAKWIKQIFYAVDFNLEAELH